MMSFVERLATHGGMATCGEHLGVFVGTDIRGCPRGWVYVPLEQATPEIVREALDTARAGRKSWPEKEI